jgi:hypothetical protein
MQIDLGEIRKFLPDSGGHLSLEFRDGQGRLLASASLDVHAEQAWEPEIFSPEKPNEETESPLGSNYLSIIS